MAKNEEKKMNEPKKKSKMAYGAAGAIVGAAIGTGIAMALSNPRTREKFIDTAKDLGEQAMTAAKDMNVIENSPQSKKT